MNADYFLFSFPELVVFWVFFWYKVQNDDLIKLVCLLKVKLFSYFKLPPLEASATALENEAIWDKYDLTCFYAAHYCKKYVNGKRCLSVV